MLRRGIGSEEAGCALRLGRAALGWADRVDSRADTCWDRVTVAGAALRFGDAIAFEARGRGGVGSRRPARGRVGVLVAAALLAGVALVAAAALVGVRGGVSSARLLARASAAGGFARLPVPLRGLVSGTLGRSERVFWVRRAGAGFVLVNGAQGFSARFSDSGVRVSARGGRLALSLAGVGYGSSLRPLGSRAPSAFGNRVSYAVGPLTQWFENGPLGLEQGFTLRAPPAGAARGPVTIALRVGGSLRARLVGGGEAVDFIAPGGGGRASLCGSAGGRRARARAARVA
jgi:hypothetical protein